LSSIRGVALQVAGWLHARRRDADAAGWLQARWLVFTMRGGALQTRRADFCAVTCGTLDV
jgi:hypothetical protein